MDYQELKEEMKRFRAGNITKFQMACLFHIYQRGNGIEVGRIPDPEDVTRIAGMYGFKNVKVDCGLRMVRIAYSGKSFRSQVLNKKAKTLFHSYISKLYPMVVTVKMFEE